MERGRDTGFSSREVTPRDTERRGEEEESEYSDTEDEEDDTVDEEEDTEEEEDGGVVRSKTPFVLLKQLVGIMKMAPPRTSPAAGEAKEGNKEMEAGAGAGASLKDGEDKKDVSGAGGGEVTGEDGHTSTMNGHDSPDPGKQEGQGGAQDKPDLNGV